MIGFDTFKETINLLHIMDVEVNNFNKSMENLLGNDTTSMYYRPLEIVQNYIISILQTEFNESKEGAEWFVYEGLSQIELGGTEISENGKTWNIKSLNDYYEYLISL